MFCGLNSSMLASDVVAIDASNGSCFTASVAKAQAKFARFRGSHSAIFSTA